MDHNHWKCGSERKKRTRILLDTRVGDHGYEFWSWKNGLRILRSTKNQSCPKWWALAISAISTGRQFYLKGLPAEVRHWFQWVISFWYGLETLGPIHWRVSFCVQHHNFGALNVHPAPIGDGMEFRPPNTFLGRTQCFRGSFGMQNPSVFHGNHWE